MYYYFKCAVRRLDATIYYMYKVQCNWEIEVSSVFVFSVLHTCSNMIKLV